MAIIDVPEVTAARIIAKLQQELDKATDRIESLEDWKARHKAGQAQVDAEWQREIKQREDAYNQCENYLHQAEHKIDELRMEISDWKAKSDSDETKIARLQGEIAELKANPLYVLDSRMTGIITDLQEQVKRLNLDNESLRYNLRGIRDAVNSRTKEV
jgi:peptidoglycan hydrolase CwlO-like protein